MTHRHRRRHTAVAIFLLLALVATLTACSDDKGAGVPTGPGTKGTWAKGSDTGFSSRSNDDRECAIVSTGRSLSKASWAESASAAPRYSVLITKAIALPEPAGSVLARTDTAINTYYPFSSAGLTQYQDHRTAIRIPDVPADSQYPGRDSRLHWVAVDADGNVVDSKTYNTDDRVPAPFDLAKDPTYGYYRVEVDKGIALPSDSEGTDPRQRYAVSLLPDAWDESTVWLALRGGNQLYKGVLVGMSARDMTPTTDSCK